MSDDPVTTADFLARYERSRSDLFGFIYDLSEAQLGQLRDDVGWAVKDHLAHLAVWQDGVTALIRREPRWAAMGLTAEDRARNDFDALNAILFKRHEAAAPAEVMAMLDRSVAAFLLAFSGLTDADLRKPYSSFQTEAPDWSDPVVGWLVGNTFGHFDEHLPWMRDIAGRRLNIASGTKWEDIVGYSRAVRLGNVIEVAGTAAVDENGAVVGRGDSYRQTMYILTKIEHALAQTGATLRDVTRTRIFVTDISAWQEVGRAHGEVFGDIRPVTSMVEVASLISPELLVEIEATAVVRG